MGQTDSRDGEQTPGGPAAQGRPAPCPSDPRLRPESAAPVQEARQQELPEHLSAIGDSPPEQHSDHGYGGGTRGGVHQERLRREGLQVLPVSELLWIIVFC